MQVYEWDWSAATSTVTADSSGNFITTLTIPANTDPSVGPVAGMTGDKIAAQQVGSTNYQPSVPITLV